MSTILYTSIYLKFDSQEILANNAPSFTGCIQDIVVNDMKITEEDFKKEERGVEQVNTEPGCPRKDQCNPNPCQNEGVCTDLWSTYQCSCNRPFLGSSCQYSKLKLIQLQHLVDGLISL
jgi:protein crumbs